MQRIYWEKGFLSSKTNLFLGATKYGEINKSPFASRGNAHWKNSKVLMKSTSSFDEGFGFYNPEDQSEVGLLKINPFNSNATLRYKSFRNLEFKAENLGFSGGKWYEGDQLLAVIQSGTLKGDIELMEEDEELNLLLIAAGLHTSSYFIGLVIIALTLIYFIFLR